MIHDFDKSSIQMVEWPCANCGCIQWMPKDRNDMLRSNHKTFYCINGHANVYNKKTDVEEVEGKLMNEYAKNAQLESEVKRLQQVIKDLENRGFIKRMFK